METLEFPSLGHDHMACLETSLARARARFDAHGLRLTELREAVLRILAEDHKALGAYDIIERLRARGRVIAPISVYRILDVLLEVGLVHRIESRSAYVACHGSHEGDSGPLLFLVCNGCGRVAETSDGGLAEMLAERADKAGFTVQDSVIEVSGHCRDCLP